MQVAQRRRIDTEDVAQHWQELGGSNRRKPRACAPPELVVVRRRIASSSGRCMRYVTAAVPGAIPGRRIGVIVPELVQRHWYNFLLRPRAWLLKIWLLLRAGPQVVIIDAPWYAHE